MPPATSGTRDVKHRDGHPTVRRSKARQGKVVLTGVACAVALMVAGCSNSGAAPTAGGNSAVETGHRSNSATTSPPATAVQHVGLCSYTGVIPYPSIAADGAPVVATQLGIDLAPSNSSPMVAIAYHQFNTMQCTHYQHRDLQDSVEGTYYYDCVGFTSYSVRIADPQAWNSLVSAVNLPAGRVPSPRLYASFFTQLVSTPQTGWSPVTTAAALLPGDLLAWSPSIGGTPDAGHSVMALSAPTSLGGGRYALVVMDSTATTHGPDDTRKTSNPLSARNAPLGALSTSSSADPAPSDAHSGLGIGTIALDTGPTGSVVGVEWTIGTAVEHVNFASARPLASF
jgi:hypothetical protein